MMKHELSPLKKIYFKYLGWTFFWTYRCTLRRFLGITWRNWFLGGSLLLVFVFWLILGRFPWILGLLFVWIWWVFRRAKRAGYVRFVPDELAGMPGEGIRPLPPNQRIKMRATGIFSLSDREQGVLLRHAEYWQVPLGDHVLMVEQKPGHYLYQFFDAKTLVNVQPGWLIFGKEPLDALAITFMLTWGPEQNNNDSLLYYVGGGQGTEEPTTPRTIYLTFEDSEACEAVWHNIVFDARQVREGEIND
jgi:hypothetical protein